MRTMAAPNSLQRSLFTDNSGDGMKIPRPKPEDVRRRLLGILRLLRESDEFPWTPAEFRSWRIVFPQMTNWLPDDEASELKTNFLREIDRWGDEARDKDEEEDWREALVRRFRQRTQQSSE